MKHHHESGVWEIITHTQEEEDAILNYDDNDAAGFDLLNSGQLNSGDYGKLTDSSLFVETIDDSKTSAELTSSEYAEIQANFLDDEGYLNEDWLFDKGWDYSGQRLIGPMYVVRILWT